MRSCAQIRQDGKQMQGEVIQRNVFEAAERLHDSLDAGEIVARAMELLPTLVKAESWAAFLKTEQADRLELVRAINGSTLPVGPFVDPGNSTMPMERAITEQRTVIANTGADDDQLDLKFGEDRLATLCVPLLAAGKLIGAVQATRRTAELPSRGASFTQAEAEAVECVCAAMARALANAAEYHRANRQTLIDDLTRLYNVRYLYQTLDNEIRRARRYNSAVSVVFMDLDGFKLVNDAYGHRAGSVTLTEVAEVILASVRESDFVARYGGDEFVLMLPETQSAPALQMAERVRSEIAAHRFTGGVGADIYLTASFGVASFPEHATESEKLIELADAAMYEAKQRKKNSVRLAAS
ncbi:MAG TPA: sensor domain-containing diguanylate cyclase [Blastocatellia bacterium]|nr:sensor domain-containing diguanylate cyclase [Blastocatellia bacterium]